MQNEDRHVTQASVSTKLPNAVSATAIRKVVVEDHEVGHALGDRALEVAEPGEAPERPPGMYGHVAEQLERRWIVLDGEQDRVRASAAGPVHAVTRRVSVALHV